MATTYNVNYNDQRFGNVEKDKNQALTELEQTYGGIIGESDQYYQAQIDATKEWANTQSQLQQEQTDFTIEQIEQQKAQAEKEYVKEQSGAYVDWRKQSNEYGTEAEKMASAGLAGTGFSESSQVSMYNTYQNRVMAARESYTQAVLSYDNAIKDARLQNNSVLAEIAYEALQQQLELSLQGFQYKNQLILEQANKKTELENTYYNRYLDVLNQINTENALAEEVRQYDQDYAFKVQQYNTAVEQWNKEYEQGIKEWKESIRQFDAELARLKAKDTEEAKQAAAELAYKKEQAKIAQQQWEKEMKLKENQLAEQKRQFDESQKKQTSSGGGGGATLNKGNSGGSATINSSNSGDRGDGRGGLPINTDSVIALGYGPISANKLAELVASGKVTKYVQNGQVYFRKNATYIPSLSSFPSSVPAVPSASSASFINKGGNFQAFK